MVSSREGNLETSQVVLKLDGFLWQFEAMVMSSHDLEPLVLIVGFGSNFRYQKNDLNFFFIIFNIGNISLSNRWSQNFET